MIAGVYMEGEAQAHLAEVPHEVKVTAHLAEALHLIPLQLPRHLHIPLGCVRSCRLVETAGTPVIKRLRT